MHPQQFVFDMVNNGRKDVVVQLIKEFNARLQEAKTKEHASVYWFVNMFLQTVMWKVEHIEDYEKIDDDEFLFVWKSLGMFGIDRAEVEKVIKEMI